MRRLRQDIKTLISRAVQRAYPLSLPISLSPPKPSQNCDFTCPIPISLFDQFHKEGVCFGLFNPREIADGIFVHIDKTPIIRKVKVNGLGELEITLDEDFLSTVVEGINGKFELEEGGKELKGVNVMVDWRSCGSAVRVDLAKECIARCLQRIGVQPQVQVYGKLAEIRSFSDLLATTRVILQGNQSLQANIPKKHYVHLTDISFKPLFTQFQPLHAFSSIFDVSGHEIVSNSRLKSSDIWEIQSTASVLPLILDPNREKSSVNSVFELMSLEGSSSPADMSVTRNISVLLAQYSDVVHETPYKGPAHMCGYIEKLGKTVRPYRTVMSGGLVEATRRVAEQVLSLLVVSNMEEYSWLQEYRRTWEQLQEDVLPSIQQPTVRSHHVRPLLRNFFLILDCSKSAAKNDFKPSRMQLVGKIAQSFLTQFRANNPLSLISILVASDGLARFVTNLEGLKPSGEFSLQNSLELVLKQVPSAQLSYSTEVLIVQNSLWSCDPGDIWETLRKVRQNYIKVSVISLVPEVYLMRKTTEMTGGSIEVALNEENLGEIWKIRASAGDPAVGSALVPLGFPTYTAESSPCACHLTSGPGYFCPICRAKTCALPCKCSICGFFLISNPHLVQASLSLKPIQDFVICGEGVCAGCELQGLLRTCPLCTTSFCSRCEDFIRSTLGHCINCPV